MRIRVVWDDYDVLGADWAQQFTGRHPAQPREQALDEAGEWAQEFASSAWAQEFMTEQTVPPQQDTLGPWAAKPAASVEPAVAPPPSFQEKFQQSQVTTISTHVLRIDRRIGPTSSQMVMRCA